MFLRAMSATSLLLALACNTPGNAVPAKPPEPFRPFISLRPVSVSLRMGATQVFQAQINYPEGRRYMKQPVAWRVVEAEGGTITPAGLYTAPAKPGTFHVEVQREDFPERTATATLTVN